MEEGILIENDEGYITFVNPRMIQMLGCTKEELLGRHWSEIFSPDYERRVREENSRLREGHKTRFEASIDLGDAELQVMVSATPLMEGELYVGNLKVFVDITERKEAEERLRHKALKYKIEWGKSYLVSEKTLDKGRDIFIDLMQAGFRGMVLSRTPPEELGEFIDEGVEVLWFSEKGKGRDVIPPQLNLVRKRVEDFASRNSVVLLDRLDYLIVQNGFNEVLKLLQELNELAYTSKAILMIVIDPDTLSKQELSLLKKEFSGVEAKYQVELEEGLLEILKFVKKENDAGRKPVHKDVARAFGITRPTAVKRLKELKVRGLLLDQKRGRYKALEVTEKGKNML
jgi:PAS domain S-box-containing protein